MNKEHLINLDNYIFYKNGRIYNKTKKRFLKGYIDKNGYVITCLKCKDGTSNTFLWHRVIWYVFNGEIPNGYEINHINEDKTDNRLENLNLLTHKENVNWGTRNERAAKSNSISQKGRKFSEEHKRKLSEAHKGVFNNKLTSKEVVAVKDGVVVMVFPSLHEAGRNGFYFKVVSACCNNCYNRQGNNHYKGYQWFFKEDWLKIQATQSNDRVACGKMFI